MKYLWILLILIFISGCNSGDLTGNAVAEDKLVLEGPYNVTYVVDGDTLDLSNGDRIRFSGINTPETGECYYQEAKDALKSLVLGKEVYIESDRSDEGKYGRKLRYIYLDDVMINELLVENGYARVYDKYKDDTKRYDELKEAEKIAIDQIIGVWACDQDPFKGCLFVGSKNSDVYHALDCKWAKKIKPENLVCYRSLDELEGKRQSNC